MNEYDTIKSMGYGFRNLTYHTSGEWSCQLGFESYGGKEFWGKTPEEVINKAKEHLDAMDYEPETL